MINYAAQPDLLSNDNMDVQYQYCNRQDKVAHLWYIWLGTTDLVSKHVQRSSHASVY